MNEFLKRLMAKLEEKGLYEEVAGLKTLLGPEGDLNGGLAKAVVESITEMPPEFFDGVNKISLPIKVDGIHHDLSFDFPDMNGEEPGLGWGALLPCILLGITVSLIAKK